MAHIFGGAAFTAHPSAQCRLAGAAPQPQPAPAPAPAIPRTYAAPVQSAGVPQPVLRGPAPVPTSPPPQAVFGPQPLFGPRVYPVMKKGEAPCPVCH